MVDLQLKRCARVSYIRLQREGRYERILTYIPRVASLLIALKKKSLEILDNLPFGCSEAVFGSFR